MAWSPGAAAKTTLPDIVFEAEVFRIAPRSLPRYQALSLLGRGGMGEVIKARDNDIGRLVAIKRMHRGQNQPELFARFLEEVRTVGQLEHPNIVPIHDAGVDADGGYFVMKYVEGRSLETIIEALGAGDPEAHRHFTFERRTAIIRKALEALRYAHSRGIVHRDLKPANIIIGPLDEVFVLDWGIARGPREARATPAAHAPTPAAGDSASAGSATSAKSASFGTGLETEAGAIIGTPRYMSPEQARGDPVDPRSDLYSLCVVFFEFLTLTHPYTHLGTVAETLAAVASERNDVPLAGFLKNLVQPRVPMDLSWMIRRGTHKDIRARFQSADEMLERIDDCANGRVPVECHVTLVERLGYETMRLINRSPLGFLALLLSATGLVVLALLR